MLDLHLQFFLLLWDSNQTHKDPQPLVDLILDQLLYLWREVAVEVVDEKDVTLVQRQLAFPHKGGVVEVNSDDSRPLFSLKRCKRESRLVELNLMDPSVSQIVRVFKEDPLLALLHNETVLLVVVKWWKGVSAQVGSLHDWLKDLEDPELADWDVELLADVLPGVNGTLSVGKSKLPTIGNHHATNQTVAHLETHVCRNN